MWCTWRMWSMCWCRPQMVTTGFWDFATCWCWCLSTRPACWCSRAWTKCVDVLLPPLQSPQMSFKQTNCVLLSPGSAFPFLFFCLRFAYCFMSLFFPSLEGFSKKKSLFFPCLLYNTTKQIKKWWHQVAMVHTWFFSSFERNTSMELHEELQSNAFNGLNIANKLQKMPNRIYIFNNSNAYKCS